MKIGMLQLNFKVGDFEGNMNKVIDGYTRAVNHGAELVVTSELALFGYPPGDMLLRQDCLKAQDRAFEALRQRIGGVGLVVGVAMDTANRVGLPLYNSAVLVHNRNVVHVQHKSLLPNYDVFDEKRYFEPFEGNPRTFEYKGLRLGVLICEDIWNDFDTVGSPRLYSKNPVDGFNDKSIDALITINASPFYLGKTVRRLDIARTTATHLN